MSNLTPGDIGDVILELAGVETASVVVFTAPDIEGEVLALRANNCDPVPLTDLTGMKEILDACCVNQRQHVKALIKQAQEEKEHHLAAVDEIKASQALKLTVEGINCLIALDTRINWLDSFLKSREMEIVMSIIGAHESHALERKVDDLERQIESLGESIQRALGLVRERDATIMALQGVLERILGVIGGLRLKERGGSNKERLVHALKNIRAIVQNTQGDETLQVPSVLGVGEDLKSE